MKESESQKVTREDGSEAPRPSDEPMLYCPLCSTRLTERRCKLMCERCGYYLSCADYY